MIASERLALLALAWVCVMALALWWRMGRERPSSGLLLVWLVNLLVINGLPGGVFAISGDWSPEIADLEEGMEVATWGIAFAAVGVGLVGRVRSRVQPPCDVSRAEPGRRRAGWRIVLLGLAAFIGLPGLLGVPTITAIVSTALLLLPIGLGALLVDALGSTTHRMLAIGAAIVLLPMMTSITSGFLGMGFTMAMLAVCTVATDPRFRARILVVVVVFGYLGLSLFVSYVEGRGALRESVAAGEGLAFRAARFIAIVREAGPFDPQATRDRVAVDMRLNQLSIVGIARRNLDQGVVEYARGETISDAALALIPRVLWPGKPYSAGRTDFVARVTGLSFSEGTSVGATPLLEGYVNFGFWGVAVFFLLAGGLLALADDVAGAALAQGDMVTYVRAVLPAAAFLNVGGSVVEILVSAVTGIGVAWGVGLLLRRGAAEVAPESSEECA